MAEETQNQNKVFGELGITGLNINSGRIYEEPNWRLSHFAWQRAVRDMTANDPVVNAILSTFEMLARQTTWNVEPFSSATEDVQEGDFMRQCLFEDMSQTWQDTLSEILSFLPWGWAFPELCYKRRSGESRDKTKNSKFNDGRIGLRKIAPRAQESLDQWILDDFNEVVAMAQLPPPDYRRRVIPFEKALHFRTSSNKGNPEGSSILRRMYRPWFIKSQIENIEAIGVERDLAGLPVAFLPPEVLVGTSDEHVSLRNAIVDLLTGVKRNEKEGAMFPRAYDENKNLIYDFQLLSSGGQRQFDTSKIIDRYDQRMLMSVMADFLLLGTKVTGSFALSSDKTKLFSNAMSAYLDAICDTFNRFCIPRLNRLNGWDTTRTARLTHGKVEEVTLEEIGNYIAQLSQANITFTPEQADWCKRQIDMPITEKENKK
jgi:hypothetical protein